MGRINPRGIVDLFGNEAKKVLNSIKNKAEGAGRAVLGAFGIKL